MGLNDLKKIIIAELSNTLKPLGFKRAGHIFSNTTDDLVYYIALQSSTSSTASQLKFTVNIEIRSQELYQLYESMLPFNAQDHYRFRIGWFIEPQTDKWWLAHNNQSAMLAAEEINTLIVQKVLPEFSHLKSVKDIYTFWKQGNGTGITEGAIKNYMHLLEQADILNK
ncbi:DUF4304 domain-containing protein [Mucilaginibacter sp. Mucisp86]|uniref:DUF4304 domain-containing protein n=1 Tax=Mucilaginibacter sp. Mucisp86 TaxID=3243060 RepID=UPI0039B5ABC4